MDFFTTIDQFLDFTSVEETQPHKATTSINDPLVSAQHESDELEVLHDAERRGTGGAYALCVIA